MKKEFTFVPLAARLAGMPPAISGAGGRRAFYLACMVPFGYGLNVKAATPVMAEWNAKYCRPPFSDRDVKKTVEAASRCGIASDLYLPPVKKEGEEKSKTTSTTIKAPASLPKAPAARTGYDPADLAKKAIVQAKWPIPRHLTGPEKGAFAYLRNLPLAAVEIGCQNGRIMADDARPGCVLLTDGRTNGLGHRQYRNLDGSPFHHGAKSDNAKGSAGKGFFSLSHSRRLDPDELVFITEGTISLFEAVACQWLCEGRARRWHFLASHFCGSTFAAEPALLKAIAGHHVRILPDPNQAGMDAARALRDELRAVGCPVDFAFMPKGFQDLRLILAAGSDGVAAARSILTYPTPSKSGGAK
jgi:hypothetical protein